MRASSRRALGLAAILAVALTVSATPAYADDPTAFSLYGCRFNSSAIKWQDSTGFVSWGNRAQFGATQWAGAAVPITLTKVTSGAQIRVELQNLPADTAPARTYYSTCSAGIFQGTVEWRYNTAVAGGYTTTEQQQIAVHEFGHALSLNHINKGTCSNLQMMDTDGQGSNGIYFCGYTAPRQGDVAGVNATY